jgi:hypothetical protein
MAERLFDAHKETIAAQFLGAPAHPYIPHYTPQTPPP